MRIAVLGGGRAARRILSALHWPGARVKHYLSRGDGGRAGGEQLKASVRAGGVDGLVIVSRFNGHSVANGMRQLCQRMGIPVAIAERHGAIEEAIESLLE